MVNFGPLAAEIISLVWGTPGNFNGFRVLAALLRGTLVVGVSQTAAFNRGCHLYSAGRPSRWALAHISSVVLCSPFQNHQKQIYIAPYTRKSEPADTVSDDRVCSADVDNEMGQVIAGALHLLRDPLFWGPCQL